MKIEIIDNKNFIEIWVNGNQWREIYGKFYKNHLYEVLNCRSENELKNFFLRSDIKIARGIVYRLLAVRGYMKSEISAKLIRYKICRQAIQKIIMECEKLGYLNDSLEAERFIAREIRRGLGPRMITYKLNKKAPNLKGTVRKKISDEEQIEMIKKWIKKKTKTSSPKEDEVKKRLYRFLIGKGFDDHLIRQELFAI